MVPSPMTPTLWNSRALLVMGASWHACRVLRREVVHPSVTSAADLSEAEDAVACSASDKSVGSGVVRLVIAKCQVDYAGRLTAHLPSAPRLILVKADGSVSIHADDRAYKPLNWMSPPCRVEEAPGVWKVVNKAGEELRITLEEILHDTSHDLGVDPGLVKDGVEAHLQELLAATPSALGEGFTLIRREYPTAIGPVDLLCRDGAGRCVAVEIKRRGEIDGVEQLTRYLELLGRDPLLAPVTGVFAAQEIKPQARVLAEDRGIRCVVLDYHALRGLTRDELTLF
jgi:endonuclease